MEPDRQRILGAAAVDAAIASNRPVQLVVHPQDALSEESKRAIAAARSAGIRVLEVSDQVLWRLTAGHPDLQVMALVGPPTEATLSSVLQRNGSMWLLSGTAYPGNAGFVIRTAEVAGADGVVIDAHFERGERRETLRASMRADRYFPVFFEDSLPTMQGARQSGRRVIAIETEGARAPWEIDLRGPVLFVVGGEREGIAPALLREADEVVRIPMNGFIASYNLQAAMAAVAMERLRQQAGDCGEAG